MIVLYKLYLQYPKNQIPSPSTEYEALVACHHLCHRKDQSSSNLPSSATYQLNIVGYMLLAIVGHLVCVLVQLALLLVIALIALPLSLYYTLGFLSAVTQ